MDYSQTFSSIEEAVCRHPKKGLFGEALAKPGYCKELQEHFDYIEGAKSLYASGYVCKDCGKPTAFYVQECWGCPEDKDLFYGRPGTNLCKKHTEERREILNEQHSRRRKA